MSRPRHQMEAMIKGQSTETLVDCLKQLNRATDSHEILTTVFITTELESRMNETEFLALMEWCDLDLSAA